MNCELFLGFPFAQGILSVILFKGEIGYHYVYFNNYP